MGTVVSFDVPDWADQVLGRAVQWLHWVDGTFSPFRDDSDVSRFGCGALTLGIASSTGFGSGAVCGRLDTMTGSIVSARISAGSASARTSSILFGIANPSLAC